MIQLANLNDTIERILHEHGVDRRRCFVDVVARPPDGSRITIECSDAAIGASIHAAIGSDPSVEIEILTETKVGLPETLIIASSVADVRKTPAHAAELVTQMIYGDAVLPLKDNGEWYLCRLDDGYVGWIRSWHTHAMTADELESVRRKVTHRIASNHATVHSEPGPDALPVTDLVIGTDVAIGESPRRGWKSVTLPDGKSGFISSKSLEKIPRHRRVSRDRLSRDGLRFLGIPYIWGGTTPKGFDCSGLMQRIYRLSGALIPRDADLQSSYGRELPVGQADALKTGDLLFFGKTPERITHVGMMLSDGMYLHVYGQVRVASLDPRHPLFDARLIRDWQISRDPLAPPSA